MTDKERKILEDAALLFPSVVTNADKIRAMSDEELANFIGFACQDAFCYGRGMRDKMMIYPFGTHESTMDWLKQEATE